MDIGVPVTLAEALLDLLKERGWETTEIHPTHTVWARIVGADMVKHVQPHKFDSATGVLTLTADSRAWATQARLLAPQLLRLLNDEAPAAPIHGINIIARISDGSLPAIPLPAPRQPAAVVPRPPRSGDPELEAIRRLQNQIPRPDPLSQPSRQREKQRSRAVRARALARALADKANDGRTSLDAPRVGRPTGDLG
ncbi:DciA family protein [Streptomyces sp. NPDC085596]|uniref:DciA family protein n=1 Tax=Streptomyces sp. NPDC085596 TaxID=3365731 RepID=UPI0037D7CB3C